MHDFADSLGWIAFWGFIAAIVIVPQVLRSRDRQKMFETMRAAYDKNQPVPQELVDAMTRPMTRGREVDPLDYMPDSTAGRDLRRGVVWTAIGCGFFLIGACFYGALYDVGGSIPTFAGFAAVGAIPLCIGLAFLGLWFFNRDRRTPPPVVRQPPQI